MNSRDLNSINEAFVQATAKVVAEDTIEEARPPIGAAAREGDPVKQKTKPWTGSSKTKNSGKKANPPGRPKPNDKEEDDEIEEVKEDLGPDFGDEQDFGDPSRHSGDYLDDEPLDVGDIVEVEGEDDDFVVLDLDGEYVNLAAVRDAIEVKRSSVVKRESVKVEKKLVTLKEKKKVMKYTDIMDEYESRLSTSSRGFSLKSKLNEEDGTSFKQPDEGVGVKVDDKTQRPKDEASAEVVEEPTENVKDDLQEPKEGEEKNTKKEEKVVEDSINNSNKGNIMSQDKSIFDKLYEQVMSEDDDFELGVPGDGLGAVGDELGDEIGDEGGEDVTVTLSPDQVDALKAVVDQFPSPEDDLGGEDEFGGDEEEPEEGFRRESTETVAEGDEQSTGKPTTDGAKPGVDPSDGGGKSTDVAADSLGGKSSGTGDAKVTDDPASTGKPTTDGSKPGVAKNSGKPGKQKANAKI
jgi:hypothetical protein